MFKFCLLKDVLLDSKALIGDLFYMFDLDKNNLVSITEFINGYVKLLELMGVKIKNEFKEAIRHIAEIVKISNKDEANLPKFSDLIQIVSDKLNAYSHGLLKLSHLQNLTNGHFNLERVIVTQQSGFTVNTKLFFFYALASMDKASDGYVDQSDFVSTLMNHLRFLNVTLFPKVDEYIKTYLEIYENSVQSLLFKYGLTDISSSDLKKISFNFSELNCWIKIKRIFFWKVEGKMFPEYENRSFVSLSIQIQDSLENVKKFSPIQVMRYIRLNMNGMN